IYQYYCSSAGRGNGRGTMPFLMSFALEHEIVTFAWIDNASVQFPLNIYATKGFLLIRFPALVQFRLAPAATAHFLPHDALGLGLGGCDMFAAAVLRASFLLLCSSNSVRNCSSLGHHPPCGIPFQWPNQRRHGQRRFDPR